MQRFANQKLADREQSISGQFSRSHEKEKEAHREVQALKKEKEDLMAKSTNEIKEL